jgi:peptidyl-prolyl cis-trans isomerase A (cyclophilin A)
MSPATRQRGAPPTSQWNIDERGRTFVADELYATLKTNKGDIEVKLFPDHAPKTVKNFTELALGAKEWTNPQTREKTTARLYDGTVFHRVISGFMIQGGDPLGSGMGGPGYKFDDEFHPELQFDRPYLLAMANSGPGTNGSQFFITVGPTPHLNRRHTIFGEVTDGASRAVVDSIAAAPTGQMDRPREDIVIESVTIDRRSE